MRGQWPQHSSTPASGERLTCPDATLRHFWRDHRQDSPQPIEKSEFAEGKNLEFPSFFLEFPSLCFEAASADLEKTFLKR
jgi:hypothetical protein